jgi:hypothetical protein
MVLTFMYVQELSNTSSDIRAVPGIITLLVTKGSAGNPFLFSEAARGSMTRLHALPWIRVFSMRKRDRLHCKTISSFRFCSKVMLTCAEAVRKKQKITIAG